MLTVFCRHPADLHTRGRFSRASRFWGNHLLFLFLFLLLFLLLFYPLPSRSGREQGCPACPHKGKNWFLCSRKRHYCGTNLQNDGISFLLDLLLFFFFLPFAFFQKPFLQFYTWALWHTLQWPFLTRSVYSKMLVHILINTCKNYIYTLKVNCLPNLCLTLKLPMRTIIYFAKRKINIWSKCCMYTAKGKLSQINIYLLINKYIKKDRLSS